MNIRTLCRSLILQRTSRLRRETRSAPNTARRGRPPRTHRSPTSRSLWRQCASLYESAAQDPGRKARTSSRKLRPWRFTRVRSLQRTEPARRRRRSPRNAMRADRTANAASATGGPGQQFGLLGESQQSQRTSDSSPRASPPLSAGSKVASAPDGTATSTSACICRRSEQAIYDADDAFGPVYGFAPRQNASNKPEGARCRCVEPADRG